MKILSRHHFNLITYQLRCQNLSIAERFQNRQYYWHNFLGVWLLQTCLSQTSPKFWSFLFKSILKLELWNIKSQFSLKLLVFLGHDIKRCALPFFGKQCSQLSSRKASMQNVDMKIKVSFKSQNPKKVFLPLCQFFKGFKKKCFNLNNTHIQVRSVQKFWCMKNVG